MALKIASKKAISVILRREATKAVIEKKRGPNNSKKLLPRTVLEALHERITALRWESALKVSSNFCIWSLLKVKHFQKKKVSLNVTNWLSGARFILCLFSFIFSATKRKVYVLR